MGKQAFKENTDYDFNAKNHDEVIDSKKKIKGYETFFQKY